jgi:hypothetical protein
MFKTRTLILAAAALCATGGVVLATAGVASAGIIHPETCTTVSGTQVIHPGYVKAAKSEKVTLTATFSGCSDQFGDSQPGNGTLVATLTGSGSKASTGLSGTATIDWPASAGLNPTNASISLTGTPKGAESFSGKGTSGAYTGDSVGGSIVTTTTSKHGKAIVSSQFIGSSPLTVSYNGG